MRTIRVMEILGTEIRTRSRADLLKELLNGNAYAVLDMSGVTFVSRSFADEICNIIDAFKNVSLVNQSVIVKNMIDTVSASRKNKRVRENYHSNVHVFNDMESLALFFETR